MLKVVQKSFICLYTVFPMQSPLYFSVLCQSTDRRILSNQQGAVDTLESSNESFFKTVEEEQHKQEDTSLHRPAAESNGINISRMVSVRHHGSHFELSFTAMERSGRDTRSHPCFFFLPIDQLLPRQWQSSYRVQPCRQRREDNKLYASTCALRSISKQMLYWHCHSTKTPFIPGLCRFMTEKRKGMTTFGLEIRRKNITDKVRSARSTEWRMTQALRNIFIQTLYCHISVKKKYFSLRSKLQDSITSQLSIHANQAVVDDIIIIL